MLCVGVHESLQFRADPLDSFRVVRAVSTGWLAKTGRGSRCASFRVFAEIGAGSTAVDLDNFVSGYCLFLCSTRGFGPAAYLTIGMRAHLGGESSKNPLYLPVAEPWFLNATTGPGAPWP